jgi:hypothetical protein
MYIPCRYMYTMKNVYTWYKYVYTFTSLYIHVYTMYIQTCKCIDMYIACLSPSMRQTLYIHVCTRYIHVYVIWSGFQMLESERALHGTPWQGAHRRPRRAGLPREHSGGCLRTGQTDSTRSSPSDGIQVRLSGKHRNQALSLRLQADRRRSNVR